MKVFLDDEPVTVDGGALDAALTAGRTAAEAKGRVIIEVWADGEQAPSEDLDDPPEYEPYAEELKLVTADPRMFVRHVLLDTVEALTDARADQTAGAEAFQGGEIAAGLERMGSALRVWDAARRAVQEGAALLGITPEQLGVGGEPSVTDMAASLNTMLLEIRRCVQVQDWAALADALAYDLDEAAGQWTGRLAGMAASLDAREGGEGSGGDAGGAA